MAAPIEINSNNKSLIFNLLSDSEEFKSSGQPTSIKETLDNVSFLQFINVSCNIDTTKPEDKFISVVFNVVENAPVNWISDDLKILSEKTSDKDSRLGIDSLNHFISILYAKCCVPSFKEREYMGYQSSDFAHISIRATLVIKIYTRLLKELLQVPKQITKLRHTLDKCALNICSEHTHESQLWTSKESVDESMKLLKALCNAHQCETLVECFQTSEGTKIFSEFLAEINTKLIKSVWKTFPASPSSFEFILRHVHRPVLGDFVPQVLPPSLLLLDDFELHNKRLGFCCLKSILENVSKAELRCLGRIDVVYDILQKQMYTNESEVLDALFPVLLLTLNVFEKQTGIRRFDRTDEIMDRYLSDADITSSTVELRKVYSKHLLGFVELCDITMVRHTVKFIKLVETYAQLYETDQESTKLNTLHALKAFITVTQPRISNHASRISKCLFRLIYDMSSNQSSIDITSENCYTNTLTKSKDLKLLRLCGECLKLLDELSPDLRLSECLSKLQKLEDGESEKFLRYLEFIKPSNSDMA